MTLSQVSRNDYYSLTLINYGCIKSDEILIYALNPMCEMLS